MPLVRDKCGVQLKTYCFFFMVLSITSYCIQNHASSIMDVDKCDLMYEVIGTS